MDMALAAHICTVKSRVPFMNCMEGFKTSHQFNKIKPIPYETINKLFPHDLVKTNLRDYSLNPHNPI